MEKDIKSPSREGGESEPNLELYLNLRKYTPPGHLTHFFPPIKRGGKTDSNK
jgi:hypothetical protein